VSVRRFSGFGPAVTDWFAALESDNSRAFWAATKHVWQRDVRGPLEALLSELAALRGGTVKLFRPHRDMRYASGEGPLKRAAAGLLLAEAGERTYASRYLEVSLEGFYAGTGYHRFERDQLEGYRSAVGGDAGALLEAALAQAGADGLEVGGEALRGAPKGFARDHPRIALLRLKGLYLGATMPPGDELETRAPLEHALRTWDRSQPVVAWLDAHVGRGDTASLRG
jgi:uncharacterized protein (TIGR02453 family)